MNHPANATDVAVVIGRFQPFHLGHLALLEHALSVAPRAVLVLGSAPAPRSAKNPFTLEERVAMIHGSLSEAQRARVGFVGVRDYYDERRWASAVERAVAREAPGKVALVGFRKDDSSSYLGSFPNWLPHDVPRQAPIDATPLRRAYFTSDSLNDELRQALPEAVARFLAEFRASAHYAGVREELLALEAGRKKYGEGPFVTVDAVVTHGDRLLLVERGHAPGKGTWALPGGFLDGSERLLTAALRELKEETRVECDDAELRAALQGVAVFDHPQRSQRGRTITHAHYFALPSSLRVPPAVEGADDAAMARWVPLSEVATMAHRLFDDHFTIVDHFLSIAAD